MQIIAVGLRLGICLARYSAHDRNRVVDRVGHRRPGRLRRCRGDDAGTDGGGAVIGGIVRPFDRLDEGSGIVAVQIDLRGQITGHDVDVAERGVGPVDRQPIGAVHRGHRNHALDRARRRECIVEPYRAERGLVGIFAGETAEDNLGAVVGVIDARNGSAGGGGTVHQQPVAGLRIGEGDGGPVQEIGRIAIERGPDLDDLERRAADGVCVVAILLIDLHVVDEQAGSVVRACSRAAKRTQADDADGGRRPVGGEFRTESVPFAAGRERADRHAVDENFETVVDIDCIARYRVELDHVIAPGHRLDGLLDVIRTGARLHFDEGIAVGGLRDTVCSFVRRYFQRAGGSPAGCAILERTVGNKVVLVQRHRRRRIVKRQADFDTVTGSQSPDARDVEGDGGERAVHAHRAGLVSGVRRLAGTPLERGRGRVELPFAAHFGQRPATRHCPKCRVRDPGRNTAQGAHVQDRIGYRLAEGDDDLSRNGGIVPHEAESGRRPVDGLQRRGETIGCCWDEAVEITAAVDELDRRRDTVDHRAIGLPGHQRPAGTVGQLQQVAVIFRNQRGRLDPAGTTFQIPVPAQDHVPGTVDGCGNVRPGSQREGIDEGLPFGTVADIAAIDQDVAIRRHLGSDQRQAFRQFAGHGVGQEPGRAQEEGVGRPVADEVDCFDIGLAGERREHLIDAVLRLVDDDDDALIGPFGGQRLIVIQAAVDEDEGVARSTERRGAVGGIVAKDVADGIEILRAGGIRIGGGLFARRMQAVDDFLRETQPRRTETECSVARAVERGQGIAWRGGPFPARARPRAQVAAQRDRRAIGERFPRLVRESVFRCSAILGRGVRKNVGRRHQRGAVEHHARFERYEVSPARFLRSRNNSRIAPGLVRTRVRMLATHKVNGLQKPTTVEPVQDAPFRQTI